MSETESHFGRLSLDELRTEIRMYEGELSEPTFPDKCEDQIRNSSSHMLHAARRAYRERTGEDYVPAKR